MRKKCEKRKKQLWKKRRDSRPEVVLCSRCFWVRVTFPPDGFRTSSSNRIFEPCNRDPFEDKMKKKAVHFPSFFFHLFFFSQAPLFSSLEHLIFLIFLFFLACFSLTRSLCMCEREMCVPWWCSFRRSGGRVLVRSIFYCMVALVVVVVVSLS